MQGFAERPLPALDR